MSILSKISGYVQLIPQAQNLLGLRIEFFNFTVSPPVQDAWVGSSVVDAKGNYEIFVSVSVSEGAALLAKIYKGTTVIKESIQAAAAVINIEVSKSEYDGRVKDDSLVDDTVNYTVIKGQVSLGVEYIPAIPTNKDLVTVTAKKGLFKKQVELVKAAIDDYGNYELKIPYRLLYPTVIASPPQQNAIANILIDITIGGEIIATSGYIPVTTTMIEQDLHIDNENYFSSFLANYDYVSNRIQTLTGLNAADFYTISKDGPLPELDAVTNSSGLQEDSVLNIVDASYISHETGIIMPHAYALVRSKEKSMEVLTSLDNTAITAILTTARKNRIIDQIGDVNQTVTKLDTKKIEIIAADETEDEDSLSHLLMAILNNQAQVNTFLKMNVDQSNIPVETFWNNVRDVFEESTTSRIQHGLQLLAITGMQPEMTTALLGIIDGAPVWEYLAAYSESEWHGVIVQVCAANDKLCIPKSIRGEITDINNDEIKWEYAYKLYDVTTDMFATTVFKNRITTDETFASCFQNPEQVNAFLQADPDYDLRINNAWDEDFSGNEQLKKDILPLQNLARLTGGKPDAVIHMMKAGIRSSLQIASMQEAEFISSYAQYFRDNVLAQQVYTKAVHTDMLLKQSYLQIMPGNFTEKVTKNWSREVWFDKQTSPPTISTTPDLETLFGNMDFCSCADCTSMYSPAAYFTDVLNFIKTRFGSSIAYNELIRRRPDIIHIDLSCKNSNTPLPYIDLVNELLELMVLRDIKLHDAGESGLYIPLSFQTSGTAKELEAYPEHTFKDSDGTYKDYPQYAKVYDLRLKKAVYPNSLPFDLALEESRVYFKHLGFSRYSLMDKYKPKGYDTLTDPTLLSEYNLQAEWLGLSRNEADIITKNSNANLPNPADTWLFYGFATDGTWFNDMCNDLETLLKRCNITYKELLQLLVIDFLNKEVAPNTRHFAIVAKPGKPADTCHIDELMLEYRSFTSPPGDDVAPKRAFFDKLHRFIRLQRATKWSIYQLDIVLASLEAFDINVTVFQQVAQCHQWSTQFAVVPEKICVLWNDISIRKYINFDSDTQDLLPSLYDTFFNNKAIINPPDSNLTDPNNLQGTLMDNVGSIMAAFNMTEDDYIAVGGNSPQPVTVFELSRIYRDHLLSKILGFTSIYELSENLILLNFEYIGNIADKIEELSTLFSNLTKQREGVFSLKELTYLFRNLDPGNNFKPADNTVQVFYESLRLELRNLYDVNGSLADQDMLKNAVIEHFAATFNIETKLVAYLLKEIIKITPSETLLLDTLISENFIKSTDSIIPANSIPGVAFFYLYRAFNKLNKIALFTSKLKLSADEVIAFQENHEALNVLSLAEMPDTPVIAYPLVYRTFLLADWVRVRDTFNLKKNEFITLLLNSIGKDAQGNFIDKTIWFDTVISFTQWSWWELDFIIGAYNNGMLNFNYSIFPVDNDFKAASVLLQVKSIIDSSARTGINAQTTYAALRPTITTSQSQTIRKSAKAKYSDEAWLKIAKPLQDELREKQRKALVAYIIAHPDIVPGNNMKWKNENDLFAYLLIDVEMQPCMKTSRIKQGISTLQLFIDRIILSIERINSSGVLITMSPDLIDQWQTWRKWYRVWEANRKVFLYPENWIEPELRDNKTTFFKDLESQLLQDEVTAERVEGAYRLYLENLEEVARLEPVSAYHENTGGKDIVHVFSRTDVYPQRYFYRRLEDNEWSTWERINVDIKSDHVAPVMWNGRLYLFWLTFQASKLSDAEISNAKKGAEFTLQKEWIEAVSLGQSSNLSGNAAYTKWDIVLNWSQYQNNKWQKSDLSRDTMNLDISKVLVNGEAVQSYSNTTYSNSVLQILTKRGEVKTDEFFKNRLYLYAPYDGNGGNGSEGVCFNLLFPGGLDENGIGLHTFLWKGDNSRDPYVLRDNDRGHQIIAPLGTRFNKMKFEEDPTQDGKLKKDSYFNKTGVGYYSYSANYFFANASRNVRSTASQVILNSTPFNRFRVTARADNLSVHLLNPLEDKFFFEDERNTYYVQKVQPAEIRVATLSGVLQTNKVSVANTIGFNIAKYNLTFDSVPEDKVSTLYKASIASIFSTENYRFHTFYHAQIPQFIAALNRGGVPALLTLGNQSQADTMSFSSNYQPTYMVNNNYPRNNVQFDFSEPYSMYNWEIFFHAPMLIAQGLANNQKFEEAQKWYHYIFNPTSNTNINGAVISTNQRFWKFYPFYAESGSPAQTLSQLITDIHNNVASAVAQVRKWEKNPFNPHIIARMRILAYMKNVLMKYLDNLIAWGDQLFRRDTIESINEATQLYILAANILGDRPVKIPPRVKKEIYTFDELIQNGPLDALSNAMVAIESFYAPNAAPGGNQTSTGKDGRESMNLYTLYFCLPPNDKLLAYWDTIADRLFKIRNCMNIDGIVRQLPLYEPPIDPALLVRATAMGININTILDNISQTNAPHYRFNYMLQKANELAADVKSLGNSLLSALEKKDAEALALLRSGQEIQLLERVKFIKELQVNDAEAALEALRRTKENTQIRLTYYTTRPFKNSNEDAHLNRLNSAMNLGIAQGVLETTAGILSAIPTFHAQLIASGVSTGGLHIANVMRAASAAIGIKVGIDNIKGTMAVTTGGYERRRDDWVFQANTASKELQQLDQQILGAEIRLDISNKELANHELQIDNARDVDAFMRSKYTNTELYNWMITQISTTYFQTYQLAFDMAKRAEWCYTYELPKAYYPSTGFIKFGYWDTLRKGLMSGEKLQFDLRKMEATYMEENKRELELTKNVSLALFNAEALLELKSTGTCELIIPEALFDLDYPGHYLRRIKSVSISIPCIAGPYTTINCELTQLNSKYRKNTLLTGSGPNGTYAEFPDPWENGGASYDSTRFNYFDIETIIATSTAQNDSGVFELNFRDERYLPFEGTGAISKWRLSFPAEFRQFDYETINDVIFHIKYTAQFDGTLKEPATANLKSIFDSLENTILYRYFSLRHEFSNEWYAYQNGGYGTKLNITFRPDDFPYFCTGKKIEITGWYLRLNPKKENLSVVVNAPDQGIDTIQLTGNTGVTIELAQGNYITVSEAGALLSLDLTFTCDYKMEDLEDFFLVAHYKLSNIPPVTPDDCERFVILKDFTGNAVTGYPAGVFDRNGNYIGVADNKTEFATLWNNASGNLSFAKIFETSNEVNFRLLGDPEASITDLRAMHALQFDFGGTNVLDSISAPENSYIDYDDGTIIFTAHNAELPSNTVLYRTYAPNTPIKLSVEGTNMYDQTFQINNYSCSYQHTYPNSISRKVSIMFNMDADYLFDTDNMAGITLYDYATHLRGFLPVNTKWLEFTSTQSTTFNTLSGIKNLADVLPNLWRFALRSGANNTIPAAVNFGTWDFPAVKCIDFGTFHGNQNWLYTPILIKDLIGTTNLPAKYPALQSIGFMGNKYSADLNLAIPNIRFGVLGSVIAGNRLPAGATDIILVQLDSVKTDTGGTLLIAGEQPTTTPGQNALASLQAKGMTITFR